VYPLCCGSVGVKTTPCNATVIPAVSPWPSALSVCWSSSCPQDSACTLVFHLFLLLLPPTRFLCDQVFVLCAAAGDADHSQTCKQINQIQIYSNKIKFIQIKSNQIAPALTQIKSNRKAQIYLDNYLIIWICPTSVARTNQR
jgi:hypothetical protein